MFSVHCSRLYIVSVRWKIVKNLTLFSTLFSFSSLLGIVLGTQTWLFYYYYTESKYLPNESLKSSIILTGNFKF